MTFTLHGMLRDVVARHGDRPAVSLGDGTLTFADLAERSARVAGALHQRGVGPGVRVAVLARNTPDYYALTFACSQLGAVLVGLNWRLSARELGVIVEDARPRVLVADSEFVGQVSEVVTKIGAELVETGAELDALAAYDGPDAPSVDDDPGRTVVQLYSSGTTGAPKGILLTHANLSPTAESAVRLYAMSERSVNLLISPLFHIGGLGYSLTCLSMGGHTVLVSEASGSHLLGEIARRGVTHSFLVPSVIQSLVDSPDVAARDLRSLEFISYGGAPMSPTLLSLARAALGCGFLAVYGMTETAGTVIALTPDLYDASNAERLLRSIGKPLAWMGEAMVADFVTGEPCPPGTAGEIWVRSIQVTPGYWNRPEATAETLRTDGWLRTGDAAYVDDDGFYFLHDRIKDMIISGGENVFPAEVEAVLAEVPGIAECAVIGVPSARWGETVKALVIPRAGYVVDPAAVIAFCRDNLAHYKCPTSVDLVTSLPHNAAGKLLKADLRKSFAGEMTNV